MTRHLHPVAEAAADPRTDAAAARIMARMPSDYRIAQEIAAHPHLNREQAVNSIRIARVDRRNRRVAGENRGSDVPRRWTMQHWLQETA